MFVINQYPKGGMMNEIVDYIIEKFDGEIMEDNPELPYEFVKQAIIAQAEKDAGKLESYDFD